VEATYKKLKDIVNIIVSEPELVDSKETFNVMLATALEEAEKPKEYLP